MVIVGSRTPDRVRAPFPRHPRTIARQQEQRGEFGVISVTSDTQNRKNMLHGYIVDPETGKNVAVIRHGEVFCDDKEGAARIAIVLNANLYDLSGNLVGRLDGQHVIDVRTWCMPIAFRNLLEGNC
jgi:hypothetical protein